MSTKFVVAVPVSKPKKRAVSTFLVWECPKRLQAPRAAGVFARVWDQGLPPHAPPTSPSIQTRAIARVAAVPELPNARVAFMKDFPPAAGIMKDFPPAAGM